MRFVADRPFAEPDVAARKLSRSPMASRPCRMIASIAPIMADVTPLGRSAIRLAAFLRGSPVINVTAKWMLSCELPASRIRAARTSARRLPQLRASGG
jgi:hypothetical protein